MYAINKITKYLDIYPNIQIIHVDSDGYISKSKTNIDWDVYINFEEFLDSICDDIEGIRVGYYFINHNNQIGAFISDNPDLVIRYLMEENLACYDLKE
jgi:hypothetical protein